MNWRIGFDEQRLVGFPSRLGADIHEIHAGSLPENGRRCAGITEIDVACIERLEQLRPGGKLIPADRVAERLELLFERTLSLEHGKQTGLLKTDAQLLRGCARRILCRSRQLQQSERSSKPQP